LIRIEESITAFDNLLAFLEQIYPASSCSFNVYALLIRSVSFWKKIVVFKLSRVFGIKKRVILWQAV